MVHNPITEEIREIRHRLAAMFDNDVSRIGEETRRRQALSGRRVVRLPSRPAPQSASGSPQVVVSAEPGQIYSPQCE
jgi:hypothetical protein